MRLALLYLTLAFCLFSAEDPDPADAPPPLLTCPAGLPLGAVDVRVKSPGNSETLPFQAINRLSEEDTVTYAPVLRGAEKKRRGEVALVLVPARRTEGSELLTVSDPARADQPHEWAIPATMSLAAFVYGPEGLSQKKVKRFLSQDDQLVAQLADYAEKTSQTEALLETLADNAASSATMNAALTGFASQYGLAVQLDKTAPPAAQAQVLFATMNPQLATYNPMGTSSSAEALGQTASIATAAATLFFGSPIGIAAGGTAMLLELRAIAFPGMVFRSSFSQPAQKGINLCGQRAPVPPHTRVAFVWALRVPNTGSPTIKLGAADTIPIGQTTQVPVEVSAADWKYTQRAAKWAVEDDKGVKTEIKVLKAGNDHALEIELPKKPLAPGDYRLDAHWDWTPFSAQGVLHLRPLSDFKDAKLDAASQNALLAQTGKVAVTLRGDDFEFTKKVEIEKIGDEFATPEDIRFKLPRGPDLGPQESMNVQIDTSSLTPGPYQLLVSQQDGTKHAVKIDVLAAKPRIDNLPILVNQETTAQHFVLKGERLNLLSQLTASNVKLELGPPIAGGAEREVTANLDGSLAAGAKLAVDAQLGDRPEKLTLPDGLEVAGPLPAIASSKVSVPKDLDVALLPNEFPASYTLNAVLDVRNADAKSQLQIKCGDDAAARLTLRVGEQTQASSLQRISQDQLFVAFDTSSFPTGCALTALLDNGRAGQSQWAPLARLIRLPQIVSVTPVVSTEAAAAPGGISAPDAGGLKSYEIVGANLEMIGELSWDPTQGIEVSTLPAAIAGEGQKQSLLVKLPEAPRPGAPLYVWMRGESTPRLTSASVLRPAHASVVSPGAR